MSYLWVLSIQLMYGHKGLGSSESELICLQNIKNIKNVYTCYYVCRPGFDQLYHDLQTLRLKYTCNFEAKEPGALNINLRPGAHYIKKTAPEKKHQWSGQMKINHNLKWFVIWSAPKTDFRPIFPFSLQKLKSSWTSQFRNITEKTVISLKAIEIARYL